MWHIPDLKKTRAEYVTYPESQLNKSWICHISRISTKQELNKSRILDLNKQELSKSRIPDLN